MPSALNQLIKCLTLCKTKCHCKSKCSNCMELELDFQEGPKSLDNSRESSTQSEKINSKEKKSKDSIKKVLNAGAITSDL